MIQRQQWQRLGDRRGQLQLQVQVQWQRREAQDCDCIQPGQLDLPPQLLASPGLFFREAGASLVLGGGISSFCSSH